MSKGSSKGKKGEKKKRGKKSDDDAPEPQDKIKESETEALEEEILKRHASKPEEPAGEPSETPEEILTGMDSLEKEIQESATINEELAPEQDDAPEEDPSPTEEEVLQGYAPMRDELSPEPDGEEELMDPDSLEEEMTDANTSEEVEPAGVEEDPEPSIDEEAEMEHQDEDFSGEDPTEEIMPSESDVIPASEVRSEPRQDSHASPEEVLDTLKSLREDVGQISELSSEEGSIVEAFAISFLKLMESFAKTLPVDISILPRKMGAIERANVIPEGELVVLYEDGRMESIDLTEPGNRDLLVDVMSDVMPKFNDLIAERRSKIGRRITFLSDITKELQTIADSLAAVG